MSPLALQVVRGEVYSARLDPSEGSEMRKTRPVVIVSNDTDFDRVDFLTRWKPGP